VEKTVKFVRFQQLKQQALAACAEEGGTLPDPDRMNPVVLALLGDSVFTFYVRMRLLPVSSHVQVIHTIAAAMVSAVMQAKAMHAMEKDLGEEELAVVKRGRNAKSMVPKSATVSEYRAATAFEALCGWLLLKNQDRRLEELLERAFQIIAGEMKTDKQISG